MTVIEELDIAIACHRRAVAGLTDLGDVAIAEARLRSLITKRNFILQTPPPGGEVLTYAQVKALAAGVEERSAHAHG